MVFVFVIIGLSILVLIHELGHFLAAKWFGVPVEEFGFGFPPRVFGKKIGETVYSVNLLPFGGFVKITGEDGDDAKKLPITNYQLPNTNFSAQPIWKRSIIVLAGIFMNIVLGWVILSGIFVAGSPEHLMITNIMPQSPAESKGLRAGDIILQAIQETNVLRDPISTEQFITFAKDTAEKEIELTIQRGKEIFPIPIVGRINPPAGEGTLGIGLVEIGFPRETFFSALWKGFERTVSTITLIVGGFWSLFSQIFVTPSVVESLTGPVGIFKLAADTSALGLVYLFELIALISLNLAVLNLIPFPALDGGRFLFFLIEKIKGSPLTARFQMIVNTAGFAILIFLMIIVTVQDITRIIN